MKKKIGILGGMGPEATVYLFDQVIRLTKASRDQDHITTIVYNNPATPDRTGAILGKGPSPLPTLIAGAKLLEKAGADFIMMPCVTAHYYYTEIVKHISIPFIHLLEEVLSYIRAHPGNLKKIGLIATTGTVTTGLFQNLFAANGLEIMVPGREGQELFMEAIYREDGVKSGYKEEPKRKLLQVVQTLLEQQADAIIAGCTEIPLVLSQEDVDIPFVNPLKIMAETAVAKAGYPLKTQTWFG
jgi:aspartate racemase